MHITVSKCDNGYISVIFLTWWLWSSWSTDWALGKWPYHLKCNGEKVNSMNNEGNIMSNPFLWSVHPHPDWWVHMVTEYCYWHTVNSVIVYWIPLILHQGPTIPGAKWTWHIIFYFAMYLYIYVWKILNSAVGTEFYAPTNALLYTIKY